MEDRPIKIESLLSNEQVTLKVVRSSEEFFNSKYFEQSIEDLNRVFGYTGKYQVTIEDTKESWKDSSFLLVTEGNALHCLLRYKEVSKKLVSELIENPINNKVMYLRDFYKSTREFNGKVLLDIFLDEICNDTYDVCLVSYNDDLYKYYNRFGFEVIERDDWPEGLMLRRC